MKSRVTIYCSLVQHDDKLIISDDYLASSILITTIGNEKHSRELSAKLFYDILASKFSTKLDLSGFWLKFVVMTGFSLFSLSIFHSIMYTYISTIDC